MSDKPSVLILGQSLRFASLLIHDPDPAMHCNLRRRRSVPFRRHSKRFKTSGRLSCVFWTRTPRFCMVYTVLHGWAMLTHCRALVHPDCRQVQRTSPNDVRGVLCDIGSTYSYLLSPSYLGGAFKATLENPIVQYQQANLLIPGKIIPSPGFIIC